MRGVRMMVVAIACAGSMVAAHGQIGGDEPGGHAPIVVTTPQPNNPHIPRISSGVMAGLLKTKVEPVYPGDADVEGTVVLHAIIGKDGHVKTLDAISGPAMLKGAAIDAVKQWTYKIFLLNGEPSEVDTTVIVVFHHRPS
jgi:periplasmic protein TonB